MAGEHGGLSLDCPLLQYPPPNPQTLQMQSFFFSFLARVSVERNVKKFLTEFFVMITQVEEVEESLIKKRRIDVPLATEHIELSLVGSRKEEERSVVNNRKADQIRSNDLVALATQLQNARESVKGRAFDRLADLAAQMEHLQMTAREVLEDARRDEDLHSTPCNLQKIPGKVYHLYQKEDGYRYLSLLTPEEWNTEAKKKEYVDSFRLESDKSWTPLTEVAERQRKFAAFEKFIDLDGYPQLQNG